MASLSERCSASPRERDSLNPLSMECILTLLPLPGKQRAAMTLPQRSHRDNPQLSNEASERLTSVARHRHVILDSHAPPPLHVYARLDREDHSLLKQGLVTRDDSRILVDIQPQPVAGPVEEAFSEPGSLYHRRAA